MENGRNIETWRRSARTTTFQNLWCREVGATYKYFRKIFNSIATETVKEDQFFRTIKIKIKIWNVTF